MHYFLTTISVALLVAGLYCLRFRRQTQDKPKKMKLPAESQQAFIVCAFSMLAKLSETDGVVSAPEKAVLNAYIRDELGLNRKFERLALRVFDEAKDSPLQLRDYAIAFCDAYPDRIQLHESLLRTLLALSVSDGVFTEDERLALRSVALILGFSEAAFERMVFEFVKPQNLLH
jgi:DnaJ like chaperone protein